MSESLYPGSVLRVLLLQPTNIAHMDRLAQPVRVGHQWHWQFRGNPRNKPSPDECAVFLCTINVNLRTLDEQLKYLVGLEDDDPDKFNTNLHAAHPPFRQWLAEYLLRMASEGKLHFPLSYLEDPNRTNLRMAFWHVYYWRAGHKRKVEISKRNVLRQELTKQRLLQQQLKLKQHSELPPQLQQEEQQEPQLSAEDNLYQQILAESPLSLVDEWC